MADLSLRPATLDDARFLFELRNQAHVRLSAFNPAPLQWESHLNWLTTRLAEDSTLILIAENGSGEKLGQVRFEITPGTGEAEVDIAVCESCRGQGLGTRLLTAGCDDLFRQADTAKRAVAHIRPENSASLRMFEKAGFRNNGLKRWQTVECVEMILEKS